MFRWTDHPPPPPPAALPESPPVPLSSFSANHVQHNAKHKTTRRRAGSAAQSSNDGMIKVWIASIAVVVQCSPARGFGAAPHVRSVSRASWQSNSIGDRALSCFSQQRPSAPAAARRRARALVVSFEVGIQPDLGVDSCVVPSKPVSYFEEPRCKKLE